MLCYATTTFEERRQTVSNYISSKPDNGDKEISQLLNTSTEFVRRERKFLGLPPLARTKPIEKREVEPITDPDDYIPVVEVENLSIETKPPNKSTKLRKDVHADAELIASCYASGEPVLSIAKRYKCSTNFIYKVMDGIAEGGKQKRLGIRTRKSSGGYLFHVWEKADEIKRAHDNGESYRALGRRYKCSDTTIKKVVASVS